VRKVPGRLLAVIQLASAAHSRALTGLLHRCAAVDVVAGGGGGGVLVAAVVVVVMVVVVVVVAAAAVAVVREASRVLSCPAARAAWQHEDDWPHVLWSGVVASARESHVLGAAACVLAPWRATPPAPRQTSGLVCFDSVAACPHAPDASRAAPPEHGSVACELAPSLAAPRVAAADPRWPWIAWSVSSPAAAVLVQGTAVGRWFAVFGKAGCDAVSAVAAAAAAEHVGFRWSPKCWWQSRWRTRW